MSVSRTKRFGFLALIGIVMLCPLAAISYAQNNTETPTAGREASFLDPDQASSAPHIDVPSFNGLAVAPPDQTPPQAPQAPAPSQTTSVAPPGPQAQPLAIPPSPVTQPPQTTTATAKPAEILPPPVATSVLSDVSKESIGTQKSENLNAEMWKGTSRVVADSVLSLVTPSRSPVLNMLVKRLLGTAAVPPEGSDDTTPGLTSLRVQKLAAFTEVNDAWALTKDADTKLIDDDTYQAIIETKLATDSEDICPQITELAKTRTKVDWQKAIIICQLRAKDVKAAQVSLDVMRSTRPHDDIFLAIADKNIVGVDKTLPFQLTPLTATTLALLRMTDKGLPGELYGHPDWSLVPALMHANAKQDVVQLGLAERAVERGLINIVDLENVYRVTVFKPEELTSPLTAHESGLRERALYFQAAEAEKDANKRIGYALRFAQSATSSFLNGGGAILTDMLGTIKPDTAMQENAASLTWIYMLANQGDVALEWLRIARTNTVNADMLQKLWPQLALAGLESDGDYDADFDKWLTGALVSASGNDDPRVAREAAASSMLLLDAAGFKIPETAWVKVFAASHNEKHNTFSATLFDRMQAAAKANRRAETALLAIDLAGDAEISLPVAVAITHALHDTGFKTEAGLFARQMVALSMKQDH